MTTDSHSSIAARVRWPAIGLFVVAALSLGSALLTGSYLATGAMATEFAKSREQIEADPKLNAADKDLMRDFMAQYEKAMEVILPIDLLILLLGGLLIGYGAWNLLRLKSRGWSRAAAILAMIPCFACCLWGLPIGLWAIITIQNSVVREAFTSVQQVEPDFDVLDSE